MKGGNMEEKEKTKDKSIRDLMQEIVKQNETAEKTKKFRFGFMDDLKIRLFGKKAMKNNYVIVCLINENRHVSFIKVPIKENALMIKDSPYVAMSDHILLYNKKPMLIIPSWSTEPFSPKKDLEEADREKRMNLGYRILLNKMKIEVTSAKKQINWLLIVGGLAVIGGLVYLISSGAPPKLI